MDNLREMAIARKHTNRRWYDKYLPFVARSPEMKVNWLVAALQLSHDIAASGLGQSCLSKEEIQPYIKLLLDEDDVGRDAGDRDDIFSSPQRGKEGLAELFDDIDAGILALMLAAGDIYDTPKLFGLVPAPTEEHALIALGKVPPPYDKKPFLARDRVFHSIHAYSADLLAQAVALMRNSEVVPPGFESAYERFEEIVRDEELLAALYPQAKIGEMPP